MKASLKILLCVVLTIFVCSNTPSPRIGEVIKNPTVEAPAVIAITPTNYPPANLFLFNTRGRRLVFSTEADTVGQPVDYRWYNFEGRNGFLVQMHDSVYLCTAKHCTEYTPYSIYGGYDIVFIPIRYIANTAVRDFSRTPIYVVGKPYKPGDTISVRGYNTQHGKLSLVTISGSGSVQLPTYEFSEPRLLGERELRICTDQNVYPGGLSGSPAYNTHGDVVGILVGHMESTNTGKVFQIRISLYNNFILP
jgi:hypothetical protein